MQATIEFYAHMRMYSSVNGGISREGTYVSAVCEFEEIMIGMFMEFM